MKLKHYVILLAVLIISGLLRFYKLDTLPPSLEWDEVATGYDAYSILKTGRDQYGYFLPLTFRSLDDYKPPLYTYLTSLSIAVLGWNDFAVRFPAALLGTLAVVTTYGMTYELFWKRNLAMLSALFLAVSPWHVNFSRLALETNSTIFFTTLGAWAFLKGLRSGKWWLVSAVSFGLDLYLYHNTRVFVPILGITLVLLYKREIFLQKKAAVVAALVCGLFIVRLIPIAVSIEGQMRFHGTSLFTKNTPLEFVDLVEKYVQWKLADSQIGQYLPGKLFHNGVFLFGSQILRNYISHFDPTFLVFTQDNPRHHASQVGLLYFIDLPLILLGLFYLRQLREKKANWVVGVWILAAPIAASVTRDAPHALRSEIFLPMFQLLVASGVVKLWQLDKEKVLFRTFLISSIGIFYCLSVAFFLHQYFIHFATETSEYWQYGRKEAALYTEGIKNNYDRVIVDNSLEQPYIFFLYYLRYDPKIYRGEGGTVSGGYLEERNHFDKYHFIQFEEKNLASGEKTLLVLPPSEVPQGLKTLKVINYLNGKPAIIVGEYTK